MDEGRERGMEGRTLPAKVTLIRGHSRKMAAAKRGQGCGPDGSPVIAPYSGLANLLLIISHSVRSAPFVIYPEVTKESLIHPS